MISIILNGLAYFSIIYFGISIMGMMWFYLNRKTWLPEFEQGMKKIQFKLLLFVTFPVFVSRKFFNE